MNLPLTPIRFLFRARDQFGEKVGVIDDEKSWNYHEYTRRCQKLANLLLSWNLKPFSRVAFLSYNTHHLLEAYYGVVLAQGIFLPLNIRLSPGDFRFILNDSEAEFLFLDPDFIPIVEKIRSDLKSVKRFILLEQGSHPDWIETPIYNELLDQQSDKLEFDILQVDEDAVAELFYTSGTTDRPKGVMLTHRNLYLHGLEAAMAVDMRESDVHLHTIPLFHVNGWGTPQSLTCVGGQHIMLKKFEPQKVFEQIQLHGVTRFSLVPTMATLLIHYPDRDQYDVTSMRKILLGGAAASPGMVEQLEELFRCECLAGYGLTETSPILTCASLKSHLQVDEEKRYELKAMTGYPIPGVEIQIVDDAGQQLPWDSTSMGEIVVRGDTVMKGYWRRPQETEEIFQDQWFHTGDMATISPNGYVLILDRKKDIIISGGENISSLEVEKTLLAHPALLECAVISVPHPTWGEVPKALVVLKPEQQVTEQELIEHCRGHLAAFKLPHSIDFFDSLPKGGTGKILKRDLREKYWTGHSKRVH
ncbi:long-chain-fatty-acid--CoA ligase [Acidobacteria bacterium AH-259-D05]|nr:long-chain-fatty-acid--CoA ligase [Acidobacteria bacterium AH-259-D05]